MKTSIGISMLMTFIVCGTIAIAAQEAKPMANPSKPSASAVAADGNMQLYRQLAADTLTAFQTHDISTAQKKARELEVTWGLARKSATKELTGELTGSVGTNR